MRFAPQSDTFGYIECGISVWHPVFNTQRRVGWCDISRLARDILEDNVLSHSDPATGLPFGDTSNNLKSAIAGETHEYSDMYPGMAKDARDEGFDEIADWFETLAKAERSHANRFTKALNEMV